MHVHVFQTNSGNVSGVLNGAYSLKSFLSGEADITDSTDVIFTSMIVQTFSQQINSYDRVRFRIKAIFKSLSSGPYLGMHL